ncbi:lipase member H-like [Culicoides brevitarsis]|uniref:lipase member H-like n=1 Tax=Culicoides brevitarsis TaxID=469753 RepID=UPI00307CC3BF
MNFLSSVAIADEVKIKCTKSSSSFYAATNPFDSEIFDKINQNLPLYFILHGWKENFDVPYAREIASELLLRTNSSVCLLDYQNLVENDILTSECNAMQVGEYLASFITFLQSKGFPTSNVNIIAHSLGSKAASVCGQKLGNGRLGAIYALDPAAPGFDPNNAAYTQCIFTAFGGFRPQIGDCHANFYMNGGVMQPMCENSTNFYCSHKTSHTYFRHSLDPENKFYGNACVLSVFGMFCLYEIQDTMGIYTKRRRGKFDCQTMNEPPYAMKIKVLSDRQQGN